MHAIKGLIAYNTVVQLAAKAIAFIVAIVATGIIAGTLGPERYGQYTIIFAYLSFAAVVIDLGLQTITVRESSADKERSSQLVADLFWIKCCWGIFVLSIAIIGFSFLGFEQTTKIGFAIAAVGIFLLGLTSVPNTVFQSRLQLQFSAFSDIAGQTCFLALVLCIPAIPTFSESPLFLYLTASNIAAAIGLGLAFFFASRLEKFHFRFDRFTAQELVKKTLPLSLIILLSQIHFKGDTLLLSLMKADKDVGIYGLAYRFFEASLVIPAVLMNAIFPLLSRHRGEKVEMLSLAKKSLYVLLLGGISAMALFFFLSPYILAWAGGGNFEEAIFPLRMLGLALLFSFANTLFAYVVIVVDRQRDILLISVSGIVINLLLNYLFIPRYSYNACAVITAVSECYGMCLMAYLAYKTAGFNPFRKNGVAKSWEV